MAQCQTQNDGSKDHTIFAVGFLENFASRIYNDHLEIRKKFNSRERALNDRGSEKLEIFGQ